jgi:monofunctional biosynthetic peptidoglycan transglycosylase
VSGALPAGPADSPPRARAPRLLRPILFGITLLIAAGAGLVFLASIGLPDVEDLESTTPRRTSWMRTREAEARRLGRPYHVDQRWIPYSQVSPRLRRAVLIAEDDAFFAHGGLDWNEIRSAARTNLERRRVVRGASTITQQLAKNLYLGGERSLLRKIREVILARRLERELSKRRIFELYLNLIEWGDGIFGAEAAARHSFGVSASDLDARQAALLAAVIINPRRYSPTQPGRRIERRARMILSRMLRRGFISEDEYRLALGESPRPSSLDWLFGPPESSPEPSAAPPDLQEPEPELEPEPVAPDTVPADTLEPGAGG